mmetsp:Transcript_45278/g.72659  ORF Transcript_45278/g.72659 Transcript_45278/m.72659 type:complete len:81 (+) Transcript_45278:474-716(+)
MAVSGVPVVAIPILHVEGQNSVACSGQVVNLVEADPEVAIVVTKAVKVAVEGLVEADIAIHPPQDPGVGSSGAMFTADLK